MKRLILSSCTKVFLAVLALLAFILAGCLSIAGVHYEPGVYQGVGQGYHGTIKLQIELSEGGIEDIEILEHGEDSFAIIALEELRELALEMNTADLDAISGATVSSKGFLSALEEAMNAGIAKKK
ncbi:MAG: FMN-binding protein [Treponema sp.]|jgi:urocanate reductase|nr:FMN-binding protein [Treponema sp.]